MCPGTFLSGIHEGLPAEAIDTIAAKHPLGLGAADDLVGAYSYLAGDASRWTTGSAIVVDGGYAAPVNPRHELGRRARAPRSSHARQADLASSATTPSPTRRWRSGRLPLAGGLQARGVGAGDVVGLLSYNSIEFLATIFAANHLGAIAMPINWRLAAAELRFILEHSQARALVCDEPLVALANEATDDVAGRPRPGVRRPRTTSRAGSASRISRPGPTDRARAQVGGDDIHRLMYTSGTTGRPKGVMLTHANLAWKNSAHITEFGFTAADVGLACGPLYHVGALDLVTTTMIAVGATTVIHRTFDAERVVDEIERSRVTCIWAAPAMVRAILDVPGVEQRDLSSVRVIIAGGEKMPIPFIERILATFPSAWFADAYGLTETVSGDTFLDRASTVSKLGSVGLPVPVPRARPVGRAGCAGTGRRTR